MLLQEIWFKINWLLYRWTSSYIIRIHGLRSSDRIQIRGRTRKCFSRKQSYQISSKFWYVKNVLSLSSKYKICHRASYNRQTDTDG